MVEKISEEQMQQYKNYYIDHQGIEENYKEEYDYNKILNEI